MLPSVVGREPAKSRNNEPCVHCRKHRQRVRTNQLTIFNNSCLYLPVVRRRLSLLFLPEISSLRLRACSFGLQPTFVSRRSHGMH